MISPSWWPDTLRNTEYFNNKPSTKSTLNFRRPTKRFYENYNLRLGLCAIPINMKRSRKAHISSTAMGCHLLSATWRKYCPLHFWTAQHSDWSQSQFSGQCPYQKLFKYIYRVSQTFSRDFRSTIYNESFSLSDVIVHVLPQNIIDIDNAVSLTPLLSPTSSNTAPSSCSPESVPLFSSVSAFYYLRKRSTSDKSVLGYIDINEPKAYSSEV